MCQVVLWYSCFIPALDNETTTVVASDPICCFAYVYGFGEEVYRSEVLSARWDGHSPSDNDHNIECDHGEVYSENQCCEAFPSPAVRSPTTKPQSNMVLILFFVTAPGGPLTFVL